MSSNYNEGPYQNWTAISFPAGYVYTVVGIVIQDSNSTIQINQQPVTDAPLDPTLMQGIITGDDSGASVDLRNMPIVSTFSAVPVGDSCLVSTVGFYTYPAGGSVGSAPWEGANVAHWTVFGSLQVDAFIKHQASYTPELVKPDPEDEETWFYRCNGDFNQQALPGFILNETCTITY